MVKRVLSEVNMTYLQRAWGSETETRVQEEREFTRHKVGHYMVTGQCTLGSISKLYLVLYYIGS